MCIMWPCRLTLGTVLSRYLPWQTKGATTIFIGISRPEPYRALTDLRTLHLATVPNNLQPCTAEQAACLQPATCSKLPSAHRSPPLPRPAPEMQLAGLPKGAKRELDNKGTGGRTLGATWLEVSSSSKLFLSFA